MNLSLTGIKLAIQLSANLNNTLADGSTSGGVNIPNVNYKLKLKNGVGSGLANRSHAILGTLSAGQSVNIDLYNFTGIDIGAGSGKNALGQPIRFEEIAAIFILNNNDLGAGAGTLEVSPAVSNGWQAIGTHTNANGGELRNQGVLLKTNPEKDGFVVGISDANDQITLKAVGGPVEYVVALLAREWDSSSSSSALWHGGDV